MASGSFSSVLKESAFVANFGSLVPRLSHHRFYRRAIKITFEYPPDYPGGQGYNSFWPDEAGRNVILSMPPNKNIRVPRRAPQDVHRVRSVVDSNLPASAQKRVLVIQIMEEVPPPVEVVWRKLGGKLGKWRAQGTFRGLRDLNEHGAAWLDNKINNFSLEAVEGTAIPRMVAFDTGGIIQLKGSTLLIRAERAKQVQRLVNGPFDDFLQQQMKKYQLVVGSKNTPTARAQTRILTIQELFGDLVELEPLRINSFDDLAFNPSAGEQLPNVRLLFENHGVPIRSAKDVFPDPNVPQ